MVDEALRALEKEGKGPRGLPDVELERVGIAALSAAQARIGRTIILPGPWAWKRVWRQALLHAHQQKVWGGKSPLGHLEDRVRRDAVSLNQDIGDSDTGSVTD